MNIVRPTGNRARVRRYRAVHRRFDYAPSPDVLPIIEHHLNIGTDCCVAGVIDYPDSFWATRHYWKWGTVMGRCRDYWPPATCQQC